MKLKKKKKNKEGELEDATNEAAAATVSQLLTQSINMTRFFIG